MTNYDKRRIFLKIFSNLYLPSISPSEDEIDVVIPIIEKDLSILPLCLEGIKNCIKNKVKAIYIVAPQNTKIESFCFSNQLIYVEESSVLGISPKDINLYIENGKGKKTLNRSGWLFQQIIKLSGKVGSCRNYLCIDSDHILIKPHTFISSKGTPVFYMSSECHKPYYDNISRLLYIEKFSRLSYVAHKMIFNKDVLEKLHQSISELSGKGWIETIIESYDRTQGAGFSEFELYGNFVSQKILRPWKQYALKYSDLDSYKNLCRKYSKYNSITFPNYMNYNL